MLKVEAYICILRKLLTIVNDLETNVNNLEKDTK